MNNFTTLLKQSLILAPSLSFIDQKNVLEPMLREQDTGRATVTWCSSIKGVEKHQVKTAEKMTKHGWQVWGVVKRHAVLQPALVMRSVAKDCWALVVPGGEVIRQYTRNNTPAIAAGVDWTKEVETLATSKPKIEVLLVNRVDEQWPSAVGPVHVWEKPNYARN